MGTVYRALLKECGSFADFSKLTLRLDIGFHQLRTVFKQKILPPSFPIDGIALANMLNQDGLPVNLKILMQKDYRAVRFVNDLQTVLRNPALRIRNENQYEEIIDGVYQHLLNLPAANFYDRKFQWIVYFENIHCAFKTLIPRFPIQSTDLHNMLKIEYLPEGIVTMSRRDPRSMNFIVQLLTELSTPNKIIHNEDEWWDIVNRVYDRLNNRPSMPRDFSGIQFVQPVVFENIHLTFRAMNPRLPILSKELHKMLRFDLLPVQVKQAANNDVRVMAFINSLLTELASDRIPVFHNDMMYANLLNDIHKRHDAPLNFAQVKFVLPVNFNNIHETFKTLLPRFPISSVDLGRLFLFDVLPEQIKLLASIDERVHNFVKSLYEELVNHPTNLTNYVVYHQLIDRVYQKSSQPPVNFKKPFTLAKKRYNEKKGIITFGNIDTYYKNFKPLPSFPLQRKSMLLYFHPDKATQQIKDIVSMDERVRFFTTRLFDALHKTDVATIDQYRKIVDGVYTDVLNGNNSNSPPPRPTFYNIDDYYKNMIDKFPLRKKDVVKKLHPDQLPAEIKSLIKKDPRAYKFTNMVFGQVFDRVKTHGSISESEYYMAVDNLYNKNVYNSANSLVSSKSSPLKKTSSSPRSPSLKKQRLFN
jgi:hypothetical protein